MDRAAPECDGFLGPRRPAGRDELPHPAGDPELLGVRRRASSCRTGCSRRPTPGPCRRTCSWSRLVRVLPRPERPDVAASPNVDLKERARAVRVRRGPDLRVDRHHVAAGSRGRRRWALLRRSRDLLVPPVPRPGERRRRRVDAREQNPLPGFTTVHENGQLDNIHDARRLRASRRATARCPSVSWIVPGNGVSEHPQSSRGVAPGMAYVTRLVNAVMQRPGLGQHRDLPHLGRLGRLLRPREAAARRRERLRPAGARARDQPVGPSAGTSTTRRSRSTPT